MTQQKGVLYLIPTTLGDDALHTIPAYTKEIIAPIRHFIVEQERTAIRFLVKMGLKEVLDDIVFYLLNNQTQEAEWPAYLDAITEGASIALLSEAGAPAVADPGAQIVILAHERGIRVIPLAGPSSILLALMASGMNGQNFAFNGYLPVKQPDRVRRILQLEKVSKQNKQTQIFMETPYRNKQLLEDVLKHCQGSTRLCIATNITLAGESIQTKTIPAWKKQLPDINKKPCIFLMEAT